MAKRAKQAKEGEGETPEEERIGELAEWAGIHEPDCLVAAQIVWKYAEKVLTPRALAEERRKAGDPSASPRDYDCGCPLSVIDKAPRCFGYRECRFKHRYEAPPRLANDPVRHQMEKAQYEKLKASIGSLPERESVAQVTRIVHWYDREVLAKKRAAS
ncbi:hypothetical protein [Hyphococcus sp.]|uniref:hypothetical protein n=1 Tax=Hyphococcus sp. TaxID=2038636 RepID=UPI0035C67240